MVTQNNQQILRAGLDIGSTTAKFILIDEQNKCLYSKYVRHNTDIVGTLKVIFLEIAKLFPKSFIRINVTGSAGMGIAEKTQLSFVQETVAASEYVYTFFPAVNTLIDLGGEDSKMIFFNEGKNPDIRMNGNCAGGTGAFIDQMATLLNVDVEGLELLANQSNTIYPIASRCGVFAKTDIQNLISRKINKADIAASIYSAVAIQTLNTLARGCDVKPLVLFCGGPLTFLSGLRKAFIKHLKIDQHDVLNPDDAHFASAIGAALINFNQNKVFLGEQLIEIINFDENIKLDFSKRLQPLFDSKEELENWLMDKAYFKIECANNFQSKDVDCFIGIDSGSTTTKIVAIDNNDKMLFSFYENNKGNSLETAIKGLQQLSSEAHRKNLNYNVKATTVTGYGEDLLKAAFNIDFGIVETIAHYKAAKNLNPNVSFILDIGGQDMKAIYIKNGFITNLEINEACSSGCGSFIEGFANSLNFTAAEFADIACNSKAPCDLGTRCTVFMNSKVKQSLREGAKVEDIAAGLAYSVIKNCLYKVLKIKDVDILGDSIVVQGGSFRNKALLRAIEKLTGKQIFCAEMPEMMGAFGAALTAKSKFIKNSFKTSFVGLAKIENVLKYNSNNTICKGCTNFCAITVFNFETNRFFSGNKCEKFFTNKGDNSIKGANIYDVKAKELFNNHYKLSNPKLRIGIPNILGLYENFQFWNTLFGECNIEVVQSGTSTTELYEKGLGTVMSDNICFPAKLAHGHIIDLIEKKVDRIFYPMVIFEEKESKNHANSFNCPIVSSYSEVLKSAINPFEKYNIPFDAPPIAFINLKLLKSGVKKYILSLGISEVLFTNAFEKALMAQRRFKNLLHERCVEILDNALESNKIVILLAGRPYHSDNLVHQKTSQILSDLGVDVISEEIANISNSINVENNSLQTVSQWAFPNRILKATQISSQYPDSKLQFVQLNSFGCGPDAFILDEISDILQSVGKNHTIIKIDEISSTGSIRLRLRSLIESMKLKENNPEIKKINRVSTKVFNKNDKDRTILVPHFSDFHSPIIPPIFELMGYKAITLPVSDNISVDYGLKYAHNEICFPATVIVGDVIKAMKSGVYNPSETAIGITQTGGQCRATNYLSLIKKALVSAGFSDVPVISIATGNALLNEQPGFDLKVIKILKTTLVSILFADTISKLYYYSVVREVGSKKSEILKNKYLHDVQCLIAKSDVKAIYRLLERAIIDFNSLDLDTSEKPRIGIVGEIFVKLNPFGNANVVNWLVSQGVEVVVPSLIDFMIQSVVNIRVNEREHLERRNINSYLLGFFDLYLSYFINKIDKIYSGYKYYKKEHGIYEKADRAEKIVDLANQFGEGWLIPAEIVCFAEDNINNVVSLQPFGCIANHVISKGIEKKIKSMFPTMNLLFLDFDGGTSEVNILNRLYFMIKNATDQSEHSISESRKTSVNNREKSESEILEINV